MSTPANHAFRRGPYRRRQPKPISLQPWEYPKSASGCPIRPDLEESWGGYVEAGLLRSETIVDDSEDYD